MADMPLINRLQRIRYEFRIIEHKFERAGGIWTVAASGVQLGNMSWASNVENSMLAIRAELDAALGVEETPAPAKSTEDQITEAVHRVYAKYGTNLQAFFEDVKKAGVV